MIPGDFKGEDDVIYGSLSDVQDSIYDHINTQEKSDNNIEMSDSDNTEGSDPDTDYII